MTGMTSTMTAQASINSSDFRPAEVRFDAGVEYIRSETATRPDPAWEHTDSHGHFHAFAADGKTPTLKTYLVHVACDGSCGGVCEGEGYDETHWKCVICGEEVEPRFIPDAEARTVGIPVVTSRRTTVIVRGDGLPPPVGQVDDGDLPAALTLGTTPPRVTVRVRTEDSELVGTGYAAVQMTYRRGGGAWEITVERRPAPPAPRKRAAAKGSSSDHRARLPLHGPYPSLRTSRRDAVRPGSERLRLPRLRRRGMPRHGPRRPGVDVHR